MTAASLLSRRNPVRRRAALPLLEGASGAACCRSGRALGCITAKKKKNNKITVQNLVAAPNPRQFVQFVAAGLPGGDRVCAGSTLRCARPAKR